MQRIAPLLMLWLTCLTSVARAEGKQIPDINESKEFPGVFHSPSATSTPPVFRSVVQIEVVVKEGDSAAEVRYANGVVLNRSGLIASIVDEPASQLSSESIESATVLLLDGRAVSARLVKFDPSYGLALLNAENLELPPLNLSTNSLVAKRRLSWHAVFRDGRKTFLYSRPLQIHKASVSVGVADDLCEVIDTGTSSLNPDRSGSALVSFDGSLVALMGRQPHWNVSPKSVHPRTKVAWAVPAAVITELIFDAKSE